jgi:hypothetical protein
MPKAFYTEKEIEDMVRGGILSLEVNDNVVLTELAYEKARSLGMKLVRDKPDQPPSAPIRPYISRTPGSRPMPPDPVLLAAQLRPAPVCPAERKADKVHLHQRIRDAVIARLGSAVDLKLLDVIVRRVLSSTGVR